MDVRAVRPLGAVPDLVRELAAMLAEDDARLAERYPGERPSRQPVHTCYVPADRADADTCRAWGGQALALLDAHAESLPRATGLARDEVEALLPRVRRKLATQPVEDLRIDFEDGYGAAGDLDEDADAVAAGHTLARLADPPDGDHENAGHETTSTHGESGASRAAPLLAGVRMKGLQAPTRARAVRTLDLVIGAAELDGGLPARFVVTVPKVATVTQVRAAVHVAERLEAAHGLAQGTIRLELQIEVPQAILGPDGSVAVAPLVHAAAGRCEGLHYGTYDFSAALGVSAGRQASDHPLADHAKELMQFAAAGTGVRVSDGSTNVLPVGGVTEVEAGWATHARLVDRALRRALWQGWDLHPGQLVTRYLVTYAYLRDELAGSAARLRSYVARTAPDPAEAPAGPGVLDEPATAQALATAVLRGLDCGAVDESEVLSATGLSPQRLLALANRTSPPVPPPTGPAHVDPAQGG